MMYFQNLYVDLGDNVLYTTGHEPIQSINHWKPKKIVETRRVRWAELVTRAWDTIRLTQNFSRKSPKGQDHLFEIVQMHIGR
jgi:hypothetical protein